MEITQHINGNNYGQKNINLFTLPLIYMNNTFDVEYLWFPLMGGLQVKSMTSQRYRATYKMAECVTMATL